MEWDPNLAGPYGRLLRPAWIKLAKPSTPTMAIDELIGEEEQNIKQKEEQKKKTWSGYLIQLDNMVASYDPHGS